MVKKATAQAVPKVKKEKAAPVVKSADSADAVLSGATPAQGTKKKDVMTTVDGVRVEITGTCEHSLKGEQEYNMTLEIPRREDWRMYLKEAVFMKLRKDDANVQSVITYYVDSEDECEIDVSFIGKDPFALDRDELFAAKCYYGLRGIRCDGDKRPAQIMMYNQLCKLLGKPVPEGDKMVKIWKMIVLRVLATPAGDTMTANVKPIRFISDEGRWIKKVILVEDKNRVEMD